MLIMKTKSFFYAAALFPYHKGYSLNELEVMKLTELASIASACHSLTASSGFTYLYCLQELWRWRAPWGYRRGQRPLPPRYPVTWWQRASAPCCSCPARTSRPPVAGGYPPCPRWPASNKTNTQRKKRTETDSCVTLQSKFAWEAYSDGMQTMKWNGWNAEASHLLGLKWTRWGRKKA